MDLLLSWFRIVSRTSLSIITVLHVLQKLVMHVVNEAGELQCKEGKPLS